MILELHRLGVTIVSVMEGEFPPDGDTISLFSLIMRLDAAHQESANKSKAVRSAKKILRDAGSWVGGLPPYGYATEEVQENKLTLRRLVVVEDEADVIREIVRTILDNKDRPAESGQRHPGSLAGICADLNARGVPTKTARLQGKWRGAVTVTTPGRKNPPQWEVTTLRRILEDPRLLGYSVEPVYEEKEARDGAVRTRVTGYRILRDSVTQEPLVSHDRILEPADWHALQTWLTTRGRGKGLARAGSLLSGLALLFCECGATMASNGMHDDTASYRCTRPKGATTGHKGGNSIKRKYVEDHVALRLFARLTSAEGDEEVLAMIEEATRRYAATIAAPGVAAERASLTIDRADHETALGQMYDDLKSGIYEGRIGRERFLAEKLQLETLIGAVSKRLEEIGRLENPRLPIHEWADPNDSEHPIGPGSFWSRATLAEKRDVLRLFVDRVEVAKATTRGNRWVTYDAETRVVIHWATPADDEQD
ncbi:hypothetical protein KNE206_18520 [Kitasatospora sp. NE20-6]